MAASLSYGMSQSSVENNKNHTFVYQIVLTLVERCENARKIRENKFHVSEKKVLYDITRPKYTNYELNTKIILRVMKSRVCIYCFGALHVPVLMVYWAIS